jgi:glycine amidinotransferase
MIESVRVNSFDEWSRLREVVVGRAESWRSFELDTSFRLFYFDNVRPVLQTKAGGAHLEIPARLLDELEEDIEGLVEALTACGVTVHRPTRLNEQARVQTPYWSSETTPALNVRDQAIVLGDTIVETAPHVRARYFENDLLRHIFYRFLRAGSRWVAMPRPSLARGSLDPSFFAGDAEVDEIMLDREATELDAVGHELIFDGAQCMRFGRDVIVNVGNQNHALGFAWLEANFSDRFNFHLLDGIADSHIDSIVVPLRPGLLMVRSPEYLDKLPVQLKKWDMVFPPAVDDSRFPDYSDFGFNIASRYIDINVLSVDENTVVVNSLCPELIEELERHGMNVVPVRHRHRRLFGGGFHCFTLDLVRDGSPDQYFD